MSAGVSEKEARPDPAPGACGAAAAAPAIVDCGWGRLLFAQTFASPESLIQELKREGEGRRDIAVYVDDPHVALSLAPDSVFLDPSHVYRLALDRPLGDFEPPEGFTVRKAAPDEDVDAVNVIFSRCGMVRIAKDFIGAAAASGHRTLLVAEQSETRRLLGVVLGVDHAEAFEDPEDGSSLWSLAVDPSASAPKVGEALVRRLAAHFRGRGRAYMDLSVMHDNKAAIGLYERLGFERARSFCLKFKNPVNEKLYIADPPERSLNPYAQIIIDEARRRGVAITVEDVEANLFTLSHGGRRISCRESLSDLTTAVAAERARNKALTVRLLREAGLKTPEHVVADGEVELRFLKRHGRVVVKPADGEAGEGVSIGIRTAEDLRQAVDAAARLSASVLVEAMHPGEDLRIVVIDGAAVACAIRRPAAVRGDGRSSLRKLIEGQSRRRQAATGGESRIPIDEETRRCLADQGFDLDDTPEAGREIAVRRTANLHTGGVLHDVTDETHPDLKAAAVKAAEILNLPVAGMDLLVPDIARPDHVIIEANERPGLANHEPQPTAERFLDLLFPQTVRRS